MWEYAEHVTGEQTLHIIYAKKRRWIIVAITKANVATLRLFPNCHHQSVSRNTKYSHLP